MNFGGLRSGTHMLILIFHRQKCHLALPNCEGDAECEILWSQRKGEALKCTH